MQETRHPGFSGRLLERPKHELNPTDEAPVKEDFVKRLEIEGAIGVSQTRYSLAELITRHPESQNTLIGLVNIVMNLKHVLPFLRFGLYRNAGPPNQIKSTSFSMMNLANSVEPHLSATLIDLCIDNKKMPRYHE